MSERDAGLPVHSRWLQALGWILSLGCLAFAASRVDLIGLRKLTGDLEFIWLVAALLANAARVHTLVLRWRALLRTVGPADLRLAGETLSFSYALNSLLPARLGDLVRIGTAARLSEKPAAKVAALLVVERIQDFLCIALLVVAALPFLSSTRIGIGDGTLSLLLLAAAGVLVLAIAFALWSRRQGHETGEAHATGFRHHLGNALEGIRGTARSGVLITTGSLSLFSWTLEVASYWLVLRAIGLPLPPEAALVVCALGSSVTMIPSAPAALGTFELAVQSILQAYGVDPTIGFGAALLIHLVALGPVTLVGLLLWPRWAPELARARGVRRDEGSR